MNMPLIRMRGAAHGLVPCVCAFALLFASQVIAEDEGKSKAHSAESVQPEIQEEAAQRAAKERSEIIDDAVVALRESENGLAALSEGRTDAAIQSLANAVGKLELVVAREPELALAPVAVDLAVYDLIATPEAVEGAVERADSFLEDGMVQDARDLVSDLASEVVISVTNIPLATYPDAIKGVAPLIEAGKTTEAMRALEVALSTLVVVDTILPLPVLRTEMLIEDAERLASKATRSDDEARRLSKYLEEAREQLELGEALGYGSTEAFAGLYRELEEIEAETADGASGDGLFEDFKEALSRAFS